MNNFEKYIISYFDKYYQYEIIESIIYSIQDGKRFRANLFFSILQGFNINIENYYDLALAIEMVHAYSLIHDDLPAMDNDDYRRGKLTNHKTFGEDIAILAGDGLLTNSFEVICNSNIESEAKVKLVTSLSCNAGINGMIYGQYLDLKTKEKNSDVLNKINKHKTGCLFNNALYFAMYITNDEANFKLYETIGEYIGDLFQLQDDLFSITKDQASFGKSNNNDINKLTALSIYSVEDLKDIIKCKFNELYSFLSSIKHFDTSYLYLLIKKMEER